MNKEEFIIETEKLGIKVTKEHLEKLNIYFKTLFEYNEHTNITAIKTIKGVYLNHFYDSLTIVKNVDLTKNLSLLDIGSGAGFPGMVLKIFFPNIKLTLLDSNNKKTRFLELLCKNLGFNDVEIINDRSENFIKNKRESYDIVTGRAVAHLRILLELSLPFVKKDGEFVAMKGNIKEELDESIETLEVLNASIIKTSSFELPYEHSKRTIISIKINDKLSDIYPRTYDKIIKKPLKKKNK